VTEHNTPAAQAPAQEPSGAARQFGGFAPGLVSFTDDVLAGAGNTDALTYHLGLARENGVTETELIEAITHVNQ
jgi:4-carboxymuconolactone decarboxylase